MKYIINIAPYELRKYQPLIWIELDMIQMVLKRVRTYPITLAFKYVCIAGGDECLDYFFKRYPKTQLSSALKVACRNGRADLAHRIIDHNDDYKGINAAFSASFRSNNLELIRYLYSLVVVGDKNAEPDPEAKQYELHKLYNFYSAGGIGRIIPRDIALSKNMNIRTVCSKNAMTASQATYDLLHELKLDDSFGKMLGSLKYNKPTKLPQQSINGFEETYAALCYATKSNNLSAMVYLLPYCENEYRTFDEYLRLPLLLACRHGHIYGFNILLNNISNTVGTDQISNGTIMEIYNTMIEYNHFEMLNIILRFFPININTKLMSTAMNCADERIMELIVNCYATTKPTDEDIHTIWGNLASNMNLKFIRKFIEVVQPMNLTKILNRSIKCNRPDVTWYLLNDMNIPVTEELWFKCRGQFKKTKNSKNADFIENKLINLGIVNFGDLQRKERELVIANKQAIANEKERRRIEREHERKLKRLECKKKRKHTRNPRNVRGNKKSKN